MSGKLAHQLTEEGIVVVLRPQIGSPSSLHVSPGEAKRFAWAVLADLEPDDTAPVQSRGVEIAALRMDSARLTATVNGKPLRLTRKEFAVLWAIASAGRPIPGSEVHFAVYGEETRQEGIVSVLIHKIRAKLEAIGEGDLIVTDPGRGYSIRGAA